MAKVEFQMEVKGIKAKKFPGLRDGVSCDGARPERCYGKD